MATSILYVGEFECGEWEEEIRSAIEDEDEELPGHGIIRVKRKTAGQVEVYKNTGRVVVKGGDASAGNLLGQLYNDVGLRATVFSETYGPPKFEFSSDDEEEEDDDDDTDDDEEDDDDDTDDDEEDDDEEDEDEDGTVTDDEEEDDTDGGVQEHFSLLTI